MLQVERYYSGKTLLVTGATGLVGKVLLETILRALPEVGKVYVLIRPRVDDAGERWSPERRLEEEILGSSAFDFLRTRHGSGLAAFARGKLETVEGDLTEEGLGMEPATYERLAREVDVIINSGALAVFDAPLDQALQANTLGPARILELASAAPQPPFVAHVSTCYVSRLAGPVFETPLDSRRSPRGRPDTTPLDVEAEVRSILDRVATVRRQADTWPRRLGRSLARPGRRRPGRRGGDPGERARTEWVERRLVAEGLQWARRRGWNDTYTFTKAMGELLFLRKRQGVPGMILRPSIIESSLRTPAPGWIDGFRMMDPLIVGFARGQIFEFPGHPEAVVDLVPADIVVNALLATIAWSHGRGGPELFQVASAMENPLVLREFREYLVDYYERTPLRRGATPGSDHLPRVTFPEVDRFLRHLDRRYLLPVRLLEALTWPLKATPWGDRWHASFASRRAGLERLRHFAVIYGPYAESRARFLSFNVRRVWEDLGSDDRRRFPFAVDELDWRRYIQDVHLPGIERYLLGRRRQRAAGTAEPPPSEPVPPAGAGGNGDRGRPVVEVAEPDPTASAESHWGKAERFLGLTEEIAPAEVRRWLTPSYKKILRRWSAGVMRRICNRRLQLRASGREHIPERGPFIIASNHTSHADTGVLLTALGRLASKAHPTAATDYWFRSPLVGWLLDCTLGAIPFDRHSRNVPRALALPAAVLRKGHSLIFYPEGTRSLTGEIQPFRSTVGLLAMASAAPVVPAYIEGSYQALPKGRRLIRRHPVSVRFGAPHSVEPYLSLLDRESVAALARRLAADLQASVEALREQAEAEPA